MRFVETFRPGWLRVSCHYFRLHSGVDYRPDLSVCSGIYLHANPVAECTWHFSCRPIPRICQFGLSLRLYGNNENGTNTLILV